MKILVVEDDSRKFGKIFETLCASGVLESDIAHSICLVDALKKISSNQFDLLLLDINFPRRHGEEPQRGAGVELLRELARTHDVHPPNYIVGITAYEDIISEFGGTFENQLWSLIHYSENSDRWKAQLNHKVTYISAVTRSNNFSDGKTFGTDLAILVALDTDEWEAVKALPCGWQPLRRKFDNSRYLTGSITTESGEYSVVAVAAPRMGMPASAVLASKIIHQFRPRYLAMTGICAGRAEKVKVGDIIVADPTWDWGSGKITGNEDETSTFFPSPHQQELDGEVISVLKDLSEDKMVLAQIRHNQKVKKPPYDLSVHFGPLVSGAAVVAHKPTFDGLVEQHRGILGLDMEAYAIPIACKNNGAPYPIPIVIKSVCDYADRKKDDDFHDYAARVSAEFLYRAATIFLRR